MFDVCPNCGTYDEEKTIDGDVAICPHCGHRHPFVKLPLFIITGASGAGKSTVILDLPKHVQDCVFFEVDVLWREEFITPEDDYLGFRNLCMRVAKEISQSGCPVALCGSSIPEQYEKCPQRRYFSDVHHLALVCDNDTLAERLKARPEWRKSSSDEFLETMQNFNQWFYDNAAEQNITLVDNTDLSISECVEKIGVWIKSKL